jgi:hypothetical protein
VYWLTGGSITGTVRNEGNGAKQKRFAGGSMNGSNRYSVAGDARVLALQKRFEDLLGDCPDEFAPRQSIRFIKKENGVVLVEIISSFKFIVPGGE